MSMHPVSARQQMSKPASLILSFAVALMAMLSLAGCNSSENPAFSPELVAGRIQKVGAVQLQEVSGEPRTGEQVFQAQCSACHGSGALGSPKFGDASAWGPRIAKGYAALLNSALKGKGNMSPQGGGAFSDFEVGRALVYMANKGGGNFPEPKKP